MKSKIFYKIEPLMNESYQVFEKLIVQSKGVIEIINGKDGTQPLFEGSLSDCEVFIRLKEKGNI